MSFSVDQDLQNLTSGIGVRIDFYACLALFPGPGCGREAFIDKLDWNKRRKQFAHPTRNLCLLALVSGRETREADHDFFRGAVGDDLRDRGEKIAIVLCLDRGQRKDDINELVIERHTCPAVADVESENAHRTIVVRKSQSTKKQISKNDQKSKHQ